MKKTFEKPAARLLNVTEDIVTGSGGGDVQQGGNGNNRYGAPAHVGTPSFAD